MNQRIKELAKQADPDYTGEYDDDMGHALVGNEAIQKFAELIVRECVAQCSEALVPHTGQPSMTHNYAVGLCQDKIKEHFGVE